MQDHQFMQQWNAGHERFSGGIDEVLQRAAAAFARRIAALRARRSDGPARSECPHAARARLTGIAIAAGVLAGTSLAAIVPPGTAGHCVATERSAADEGCLPPLA